MNSLVLTYLMYSIGGSPLHNTDLLDLDDYVTFGGKA